MGIQISRNALSEDGYRIRTFDTGRDWRMRKSCLLGRDPVPHPFRSKLELSFGDRRNSVFRFLCARLLFTHCDCAESLSGGK